MNKIDPNKFYKPREIANNNWIVNSAGNGDYDFIHKLLREEVLCPTIIKTGKRRNYTDFTFGAKKIPHHGIKGEEIINFRKEHYGEDIQSTE